jgi:ferrochelatase
MGDAMSTIGVLLMTYGAPRDDADLVRYLAAVRGGRAPSDELVAEMGRRYARIGGSPLVRITRDQAAALERRLGPGFVCEAGMRYSDPTILESAHALVARGATTLVGIVLSPQWSPSLMSGYRGALDAAGAELGVPSIVAEAWYREPAFASAVAERVTEALADATLVRESLAIIFTAHSLPRRVFDAEPEYVAQLRETAGLIAARVPLAPDKWRWAYQSAGHTHEEWLGPDLKEVFPELAASGHTDVLVVPVQFVADHLEVLYDLDVAAAQEAAAAGLRYRRIAMPNMHFSFISALRDVARAVTASGAAATQLV